MGALTSLTVCQCLSPLLATVSVSPTQLFSFTRPEKNLFFFGWHSKLFPPWHETPAPLSYLLDCFCFTFSAFLFPAALEKKSPSIGSGVEVAPGLAAAAASSRGLQSRGSGGHLSPSLTSSSASAAAHQGVKKEPMDQGISSSSRSRGFSPDSHAAVHQYHAAAAARATPPHLSHPSPYSAYFAPEAAKLPPSLSGLTKDFHLSSNYSFWFQDPMVDPPTCLSCTIRSLTSTEPKDPIQLQPTLETQFSSNLHLRVETQVEAKPAVVLSDQVIPAGTQASILKCSKAKKPHEVNKQKKVIASRLRRKWGVHCALCISQWHCALWGGSIRLYTLRMDLCQNWLSCIKLCVGVTLLNLASSPMSGLNCILWLPSALAFQMPMSSSLKYAYHHFWPNHDLQARSSL